MALVILQLCLSLPSLSQHTPSSASAKLPYTLALGLLLRYHLSHTMHRWYSGRLAWWWLCGRLHGPFSRILDALNFAAYSCSSIRAASACQLGPAWLSAALLLLNAHILSEAVGIRLNGLSAPRCPLEQDQPGPETNRQDTGSVAMKGSRRTSSYPVLL